MKFDRILLTILLLPLAMVIAGVWGTFIGAREYSLSRQSVTWPGVEGRIIQSDLVEKTSSEVPHKYRAEIRYGYAVAGREFSGRNVMYDMSDDAHDIVRRYPVGTKVVVRYAPTNPAKAVLEPGAGMDMLILPASAGLMACLGCLFIILIFRTRMRHRAARGKRGCHPTACA